MISTFLGLTLALLRLENPTLTEGRITSPPAGRLRSPREKSVEAPSCIVVEPTSATAEIWDDFAQACGASFWCSWGGARMWQLKLHLRFRLKRFDLFWASPSGDRQKIGQCVIGVGSRLRVFSDGIVLRPEHEALWPQAMESLLARLGPGRYVYGSLWSTEARRHQIIGGISKVRVAATRLLVVESVDLSRFAQWSDLLKSLSRNVLRNVKSFNQAHSERRLIARGGTGSLTIIPLAIRLRGKMYDRKQIAFSHVRAAVNYTLRSLMLKLYARMWATADGREFLAAAGTVSFGKAVYFLDAASQSRFAGAGWDLLLKIIEDAKRSGFERFLLGYTDVTADFDGGVWESPVRYRRDCRAQAFQTSIVAFDFGLAKPNGHAAPSLLMEKTDPCWPSGEQG